jgi:tetratricopeptide (TPR) repeat protein
VSYGRSRDRIYNLAACNPTFVVYFTLGHMNTIARIGVYLLVFAAGGGVGTYVGYQIGEAKAFAHEMAEVSHYSEYLQAQRTKGSDVAYEDALKAYLTSLEMRSRSPSPMFQDKVYATDSALTYVRLSILASKRGAQEEASTYLKKAVDLCPRIGTHDCSAAALREMVIRLDKGALTK